jgi:hypothetical protein
MAIRKNFETQFGFTLVNAYHKVMSVKIENKTSMAFSVGAFVNSEKEIPAQAISYSCSYDLNGGNALNQAYNHLKSLPEFAGAVDC